MKTIPRTRHSTIGVIAVALALSIVPAADLSAAPAALLFQDSFSAGIPGWTPVQPAGVYIEGPMLWQYDAVSDAFSEQSNIYTDSSAGSTSRRTVMLINDTVAPTNFVYTARLTAGDDDGFGLIWGYENETTFYRISFARQARTFPVWPPAGMHVDRMSNSVITDISGPHNPPVNVANRPFDVTLTVNNGLLTVVVVDDPLGAATVYNPITDLPLPSAPSAKVGIFSWGMAGSTPRSFRIQNPVLAPTPLTGDPVSMVLSNWSFTTTPSTTNDYPVTTGMWSAGLGPNGRKVMNENNDQAPENSVPSSTNTPVFAAVAGDVTWSNYVYSVRFFNSDDDGFGLFLRYQDRTNWYRIGFRAQASGSGVKQGISVQKNVNRTFDQMLSSTAFLPPINAAFDVHAAIRGNSLQIVCVQNPDGTSPTLTRFGPIDMSASALVPANLDTGKIGVFSWAQYGPGGTTASDEGTAVESVKVRQVDGEGLFVSSPFGTPNPPVGLNDLPVNGSITATVDSAVSTAPGVRQLCIGWTGNGSVPTSGSTNEAVFTLSNLSFLAWNWQTQYELAIAATTGGSAVASVGPWVNIGSNVTITATANPGYVFTGWSGDSLSTAPILAVQMTGPRALTAHFAVDSDSDGLPDEWENQYFGNLSEPAAGDPDSDFKNNLAEFQSGTNPNAAENLVLADGFASRWINETRDRAVPGWFGVTNFGSGFRGLWETSNQNRAANSPGPDDGPFISATSYGTNASFQGPLLLVRTNLWDPAWAGTFSLSAEFSVGDNDGSCLYFRYLDSSNWFRVTLCGNDAAAPTRPVQGLSVQMRTNGWFSVVNPTSVVGNLGFFPDPLDLGYKRFRVTVNGTNDTFEVRVIGWNVNLNPNDWDPNSEQILTFTESALPTGRIGVGSWGQSFLTTGVWNSTTNDPDLPGELMNPVGAGMFADNIILQVDGTNAFMESWETAPLHTDLPTGWENPYGSLPNGLLGDWHLSAHGTIASFTAQFGTPQSGTTEFPKADGEGPILLAPPLTNSSHVLEMGIHPLDDGGMGFVYDFKDTNNFARVLFDSQVPTAGQLAQGLNVSRKSGGTWSTIVAGDNAFIYTPGRPFDVRFANNNGVCTLSAWNSDTPGTVSHWQWTDQVPGASNRVGAAIWDMPDAHYPYFRAASLDATAPAVPFEITAISLIGANVVLDISKPAGASYHILRATEVSGPYITNAASQTAAQYSEPAPVGSTYFYRLQLLP